MKRRRGFTLIEMMIVVAIIALLATIAIPNYVNFQLRAKTSEAKANLGAIRTCQEAYKAEYDVYLTCGSNPSAVPQGTKATWSTTASGWDAVGFEPKGEVRYQYAVAVPSGGQTFTATAIGDLNGDTVTATYTMAETGILTPPANPLD